MSRDFKARLFLIVIPGLMAIAILSFYLLKTDSYKEKVNSPKIIFGKTLFNSVVKSNSNDIKKTGLTEKKINGYRNDFKEYFISVTKRRTKAMKMYEVKDKQYEELFNVVSDGMKKTTFTVRELSSSETRATLEFSIIGLDLNPHFKEVRPIMRQAFEDNEKITDEELFDLQIDLYKRIINKGAMMNKPVTATLDIQLNENEKWEVINDYQVLELMKTSLTF